MRHLSQERGRELAAQLLPGTKSLVFGKEGGLVEIMYAAAGFLHVRREVYKSIARVYKLPACNLGSGKPLTPLLYAAGG